MGYFSNGTDGALYHEEHCTHCLHDENDGCPVWDLHLVHNREECNKPNSFLHFLIPRKDGVNGKCKMFVARQAREQANGTLPGA